MPTPIGHGLAGALVYAISTKGKDLLKSWRWLLVCVFFAALPDVDFLPALFGKLDLANRLHRHVTHTLLFAILVSAGAFAVLKALRRQWAGRHSLILFFCLLSHMLLDLMGQDTRAPIGIPLLWPLVGKGMSIPVQPFLDLHKDTYAEMFDLHNLGVMAYEVLLFGSILLIVVALKLRGQRTRGPGPMKLTAAPRESL
jgi:membrane-bound metal-dependent hydrolase YbcI (DUF457 family)